MSRDPARIPLVLKAIEHIWVNDPDLRLGQLMVNIISGSARRLFYLEDEHLLSLLTAIGDRKPMGDQNAKPPELFASTRYDDGTRWIIDHQGTSLYCEPSGELKLGKYDANQIRAWVAEGQLKPVLPT